RDLLFEAARASIPEHRGGPGEIPQCRGMAFERTAGHATSLHFAVGETFATLVATCARQAAVDRQALVVEERLAERALLLREWIGGGKRPAGRAAKRCLGRATPTRRPGRGRRLKDRGRTQRSRCRANPPARQKRRGGKAHPDRRAHPRHISLPPASSMR